MPSSNEVRPASLAPTNISATLASSNKVRNRALLTWPYASRSDHRTGHSYTYLIPARFSPCPRHQELVPELPLVVGEWPRLPVGVRVADQHALAVCDVMVIVVHLLVEGPRRGADPGDHGLDPQHQAGPELRGPQVVDGQAGGDIAPAAMHP